MKMDLGQTEVERQARSLARRVFSGQRRVVKGKENHIANVANKIYGRWRVGPYQWQVKHVRWILVSLTHCSSGTKYRYFRYIRACLIYLNKWCDWEPHLHGPWQNP